MDRNVEPDLLSQMSGFGTKRRCRAARGIFGAGVRPAGPSACRPRLPLTKRTSTASLLTHAKFGVEHSVCDSIDDLDQNSPTCLGSVGASTFAERAAPTTDDLQMKVAASPLSA